MIFSLSHRLILVAGFLFMWSWAADASEPGIDPLQRPEHKQGLLEYQASIHFTPGGEAASLRIGDETAQMLEKNHEWGVRFGTTYYVSDTAALWVEGVHQKRDRDLVIWNDEQYDARNWTKSRWNWVLGMRYRWNPSSPLDPHFGITLSTDQGPRVDLTVIRVADPAVISLSIARSFKQSGKGPGNSSGRIDVSSGLGVVLNENTTLILGLAHSEPVSEAGLGMATFSLKWAWERDPVHHEVIGVWGALTQTGRRGSASFGLEWQRRLNWTN